MKETNAHSEQISAQEKQDARANTPPSGPLHPAGSNAQMVELAEGIKTPSPAFPYESEIKSFIERNIKNPDLIRKHIFHELGTMPTSLELATAIGLVAKDTAQISTAHAVIDAAEARSAALSTAHRAAEKAIGLYEETGNKDYFSAWKDATTLIERLTSTGPGVQVNTQVNVEDNPKGMMAQILKEVELELE